MKKAIKELEALSKVVLDLKKEVIPRRPIVIEFCGSPKSGKTSCMNSLNLFLRRNNFRTRILTERASVCPVRSKYDPYFNLWTMCSAIAELSEVLSNHAKDYDIVIMDRGIFDALCWFNWSLEKQKIDHGNFADIERFLTMRRWRSVIDLVYVFTATPAVSLEREFSNLLTRKTGSIMQPDVLASYKKTIEEMEKKYGDVFKKVERVDTSETEPNEVNYRVTKNILEILERNTSERIGYLDMDTVPLQKDMCFPLDNIYSSQSLAFDVRREVEGNDRKLQPIPILVITNKERKKILVVRKNTKTPASSPESQKLLIYFGGHVRQEDTMESRDTDLISVSLCTLHREVKEETGIDYYPDAETPPLCIWDTSNEKSRRHLAMCYVMEVDFDTLKVKIDKNEFINSGNTLSGKVLNIREVVRRYDELEAWGRKILKKIFDVSVEQQVEMDI